MVASSGGKLVVLGLRCLPFFMTVASRHIRTAKRTPQQFKPSIRQLCVYLEPVKREVPQAEAEDTRREAGRVWSTRACWLFT